MRRSATVSCALFLCLFLVASAASAEGSSELRTADGAVQPVVADTVLHVDVIDPSAEDIYWSGEGLIDVTGPTGAPLGTVASGGSLSPPTAGTYEIRLGADQTTEWDLGVRASGVAVDGRVSAKEWHLRTQSTSSSTALSHSFYAARISGDSVTPGVIEVRVEGLSGDDQVLRATPLGIPGSERSSATLAGGSEVGTLPLYRLYLNAPDIGTYTWSAPTVSGLAFYGEGTQSCDIVAAGGPAGSFEFDSSAPGSYELACDTDRDGIIEPTSDDFARYGEAVEGHNSVPWSGVDRSGSPLAAGSYECRLKVNVGELHFITGDLETVYPGLRFFDVDSGGQATSLPMYWDDRELNGSSRLPSGETALETSPTSGVSSGLSAEAFNPATTEDPSGNARAWGRFSNNSVGSGAYLDTYTMLAQAAPQVVTARVMNSSTDTDSDGLSDIDEECLWGTDPTLADSDGDSLDDAAETLGGMQAVDTDGDGKIDALDSDDDNDTILTSVEVSDAATHADDVDQDGAPNWLDTDSDGDGFLDEDELRGDYDGDGLLDYLDGDDADGPDADLDGDGLINSVEWTLGTLDAEADSDQDGIDDSVETDGGSAVDTDNDGTIDALDADSDDDGVEDSVEMYVDSDGDGLVDARDPDDDNDGLPTLTEVDDGAVHGDDVDLDGIVNWLDTDSDGDGKADSVELDGDNDDDTIPNYLDVNDSDGPDADLDQDGLINRVELTLGTNVREPDSDGDGLDDSTETNGGRAIDTDRDGQIDALDLDSDNDHLADADEAGHDTDADGIPDWRDHDDDGDGIPTSREYSDGEAFGRDLDGDGLPIWYDLDSDGDSVEDAPIHTVDSDGDGIPDYVDMDESDGPDADADGDGLTNSNEKNLGTDPTLADSDDDGLDDGIETNGGQAIDTDGDGAIDALDPDSDDDGVPDATEGRVNSDDDVHPDWRDTDDDNDGIPSSEESTDAELFGVDIDADDLENWRDTDADGDGVLDSVEQRGDSDGDGTPNYVDPDDRDGPDGDLDGDGLSNAVEVDLGINPNRGDSDDDGIRDALETDEGQSVDTDGDGLLDALDLDSDADLILDGHELTDDPDGDGVGNWRDPDADGDGREDIVEAGDEDLATPPIDTDGDGTPDFLDLDSDDDGRFDAEELDSDFDEDGVPDWRDAEDDSHYELEGSCATGSGSPPALWLLLAFSVVFLRLRRWVVATAAALCAVILLFAAPANAQDMTAAVQAEHFEPVHSQSTGTLNLHHSDVVGHMELTGGLFMHGSHDSIVVRRVTASREFTSSHLVENQFKAELGMGVGLFGRGELGLVLPMVGYQGGSGADVTGLRDSMSPFAVGDLRIIPKLQVVDSDRAGGFGMGVALPVYAPTGDTSQFQSDGQWRAEPRLVFDYRVGEVLLMANAGYQFRPVREVFDGFQSGPMLRWGAGIDTRLGVDWLGLVASIYGDYGVAPLLDRTSSDHQSYESVEALGGINLTLPSGFRATVGAGKGLSRTLGSPDYRVFASMHVGRGEAPPDSDEDGVVDRHDKCVDSAEDVDGFDDHDGCPDEDNDGDRVMDAVDDCPDEAEDVDGFHEYDGCPDYDNDGDGIRDGADECPNAAGSAADAGCPADLDEPAESPDYDGSVSDGDEGPSEDESAPEESPSNEDEEVSENVMDFSDDPALQDGAPEMDEDAAEEVQEEESDQREEELEPHEKEFPSADELLGY